MTLNTNFYQFCIKIKLAQLESNVIIEESTWMDIWTDCYKGIRGQLWKECDWKEEDPTF